MVITGASRGLGTLLAHAFSHAGAAVALVARTERDLKAVADALPGPSLVLSGDVTDEDFNEAVADATVAEWGGLDVWIGNAGISPARGRPARDRRRRLASGPRGQPHRRLPRRPGRRPGDGRGGRLIFTGLGAGRAAAQGPHRLQRLEGRAGGAGQGAGARSGPGRHHRQRRRPGLVRLPHGRGWKRNPELADAITGHTAQRRWGASTDLAGAYQFLASDAAAFVTGAVLTVDGGYLLV